VSEQGGPASVAPLVGGERREGGCFCGAVRYRVGLPLLWVAHCHCSMCRRSQGAGFVTWFGAEASRFELLSGADVLREFASSPGAARNFCGRCGSPLLFRSERWPGQVHVTLASLDDASGVEPQAHAYWGSRAPWADWSAGPPLAVVEPEEGDGG